MIKYFAVEITDKPEQYTGALFPTKLEAEWDAQRLSEDLQRPFEVHEHNVRSPRTFYIICADHVDAAGDLKLLAQYACSDRSELERALNSSKLEKGQIVEIVALA